MTAAAEGVSSSIPSSQLRDLQAHIDAATKEGVVPGLALQAMTAGMAVMKSLGL